MRRLMAAEAAIKRAGGAHIRERMLRDTRDPSLGPRTVETVWSIIVPSDDGTLVSMQCMPPITPKNRALGIEYEAAHGRSKRAISWLQVFNRVLTDRIMVIAQSGDNKKGIPKTPGVSVFVINGRDYVFTRTMEYGISQYHINADRHVTLSPMVCSTPANPEPVQRVDLTFSSPRNGVLRTGMPYDPAKILDLIARPDLGYLDGDRVATGGLRLRTFKEKGITCAGCGVVGSKFYKERHQNAKRWTLQLYAVVPGGNEVLMTRDHIVPSSKGGPNRLDNLQTMCENCNSRKSDNLEE